MANTYTLISSVTVGAGGASSIDFTSIPATYTDLLLKVSVRSTRATVVDGIYISLNSSSSNFNWRSLEGEPGTSTVGSYNNTTNWAGVTTANSATASVFGNAEIYIPNYADSNYKSISSDSVSENNASTAVEALGATLWSNTSAITSISLAPSTGSFAQYSTAYLYGVKKS